MALLENKVIKVIKDAQETDIQLYSDPADITQDDDYAIFPIVGTDGTTMMYAQAVRADIESLPDTVQRTPLYYYPAEGIISAYQLLNAAVPPITLWAVVIFQGEGQTIHCYTPSEAEFRAGRGEDHTTSFLLEDGGTYEAKAVIDPEYASTYIPGEVTITDGGQPINKTINLIITNQPSDVELEVSPSNVTATYTGTREEAIHSASFDVTSLEKISTTVNIDLVITSTDGSDFEGTFDIKRGITPYSVPINMGKASSTGEDSVIVSGQSISSTNGSYSVNMSLNLGGMIEGGSMLYFDFTNTKKKQSKVNIHYDLENSKLVFSYGNNNYANLPYKLIGVEDASVEMPADGSQLEYSPGPFSLQFDSSAELPTGTHWNTDKIFIEGALYLKMLNENKQAVMVIPNREQSTYETIEFNNTGSIVFSESGDYTYTFDLEINEAGLLIYDPSVITINCSDEQVFMHPSGYQLPFTLTFASGSEDNKLTIDTDTYPTSFTLTFAFAMDSSVPFPEEYADSYDGWLIRDLSDSEYTFTLVDENGDGRKIATNTADGLVQFGPIELDHPMNLTYSIEFGMNEDITTYMSPKEPDEPDQPGTPEKKKIILKASSLDNSSSTEYIYDYLESKNGVALCLKSDVYKEPMNIDNKINLPDNTSAQNDFRVKLEPFSMNGIDQCIFYLDEDNNKLYFKSSFEIRIGTVWIGIPIELYEVNDYNIELIMDENSFPIISDYTRLSYNDDLLVNEYSYILSSTDAAISLIQSLLIDTSILGTVKVGVSSKYLV